MKVEIGGQKFEIRAKVRNVVMVEFMQHGKPVAGGFSVQNPTDEFNPEIGHRIAVGRALNELDKKKRGRLSMNKKKLVGQIVNKIRLRGLKNEFKEMILGLFGVGEPVISHKLFGLAEISPDNIPDMDLDGIVIGGAYGKDGFSKALLFPTKSDQENSNFPLPRFDQIGRGMAQIGRATPEEDR